MLKIIPFIFFLTLLSFGCSQQSQGQQTEAEPIAHDRSIAQEKNIEILSQFNGVPVVNISNSKEIYSNHLKLGENENGFCSVHEFEDGSILEYFVSNSNYAGHYMPSEKPEKCSCELFDLYFETQITRPYLRPAGEPGAEEKAKFYLVRKKNLELLTKCKFGKKSTDVTPKVSPQLDQK